MDWLHVTGVDLIYTAQRTFQGHKDFMIWMSHFGNPRNAFLLYFPIAFNLNHSAGVRILWLASISEWTNAVFKWFLHGERPYWWVHETSWYRERSSSVVLDQYHVSCETGPGSPSGHAMVTAAVIFVLVKEVIQPFVFDTLHFNSRSFYAKFLWFIYSVFMGILCVSRCFVAAHFPHQVVVGTFTGVLLALSSYRLQLDSIRLVVYAIVSLILLCFGLAIYLLVQVAGVDPMWSLVLAQKWCLKKEWIHLDTTLFAAIVRDASCLLGLGVGLAVTKSTETIRSPICRVASIVLSLILTQGSQFLKISQDSPLLFYVIMSIIYVLMMILIVIIPNILDIANKLLRTNDSYKNA